MTKTTARTYTWADEILHTHADGTTHEHAGTQGFTIGGQVIADTLGDVEHEHSTITFGNDRDGQLPVGERPTSGPVIWSARAVRS